jgi:hypothetical protein
MANSNNRNCGESRDFGGIIYGCNPLLLENAVFSVLLVIKAIAKLMNLRHLPCAIRRLNRRQAAVNDNSVPVKRHW